MPREVPFTIRAVPESIREGGAGSRRIRQDAMRQNVRSTVKYCALAIALTMGAGCDSLFPKQLSDDLRWSHTKMLSDGWLESNVTAQPPVYCYHTLADADCFTVPKHEHKDRLINSSY
jgi:hypothetical protein